MGSCHAGWRCSGLRLHLLEDCTLGARVGVRSWRTVVVAVRKRVGAVRKRASTSPRMACGCRQVALAVGLVALWFRRQNTPHGRCDWRPVRSCTRKQPRLLLHPFWDVCLGIILGVCLSFLAMWRALSAPVALSSLSRPPPGPPPACLTFPPEHAFLAYHHHHPAQGTHPSVPAQLS